MRITFEFGSDQGVSDLSTASVMRLFPPKRINGDLFKVYDTLVLYLDLHQLVHGFCWLLDFVKAIYIRKLL